MTALFDPIRNRDNFRRVQLNFELQNEFSTYLPTSVGNAAGHGIDAVVYAWLSGLADEIRPALVKYRDWLSNAIVRDERYGDAPELAAAQRCEAYALSFWMLENENQDALHREALTHLELAWKGNWDNGRPATNRQILRDSIVDYLANCLQCGEFERGISMYQKLGGSTKFVRPRARIAAEFGYWACVQRASATLGPEEYIEIGSRYLTSNLEVNWLGHGLARVAAAWLKIVFWHTGVTREPLGTILKAYDVMPHVTRPGFV